MKSVYESPVVEKISFCYRDQVVAMSGLKTVCTYINNGGGKHDTCGGNENSANRIYNT